MRFQDAAQQCRRQTGGGGSCGVLRAWGSVLLMSHLNGVGSDSTGNVCPAGEVGVG